MKKIFEILSLSLLALVAFSCAKPSNYINVSDKLIEVPAAGETVTVKVSSNITWSMVTSEADWIFPKRNTSEGTITIRVTANTTPDSREAVLTLKGEDVVTEIKIVQAQLNIIELTSDGSVELDDYPQGITAKLSSNVNYTVKIQDESWVSVLPASKGMVPSEVSFAIKENLTKDNRSCKIEFIAPDCSVTLTVIQLGKPRTFGFTVADVPSYSLPALDNSGEPATVTVDGETSYYKSGEAIKITKSPQAVTIGSRKLDSFSFKTMTGLKQIDFSTLY